MATENETPQTLGTLRCLRCRGEMVKGWIPERASAHEGSNVLHWFAVQEDQPKKNESSFLDFLGSALSLGEYERSHDGLPVVTMRCVRCGYLEAYARPENAEGK